MCGDTVRVGLFQEEGQTTAFVDAHEFKDPAHGSRWPNERDTRRGAVGSDPDEGVHPRAIGERQSLGLDRELGGRRTCLDRLEEP